MMIAMFSFTGVPPTLGFWGKFYVFHAAIRGRGRAPGGDRPAHIVTLGVLLLRVVVMYMRSGEPTARQDGWLGLVTIGSAAAVVLLQTQFPHAIQHGCPGSLPHALISSYL